MLINDVDLPTFYNVMTIDGNYAIEARGIWEMENDFMGGAFVSYIIHDSKRQNIVFVDGFIHAPGQTKRKYMQDLTLILNTVKF